MIIIVDLKDVGIPKLSLERVTLTQLPLPTDVLVRAELVAVREFDTIRTLKDRAVPETVYNLNQFLRRILASSSDLHIERSNNSDGARTST